MKKKIVLAVIVILVCFLVGFIFFKNRNVKDNGGNVNYGEEIINNNAEDDLTNGFVIDEEVVVDNLKFTNIKFNYIKREEFEFLADVENLGNELIDSKNVDIKVFDANGEVISIFGGILKPLMSNEKGVLKSYVLGDLTGAKKVEFQMIEE